MKEERSTYGGECTCGDVESDEEELASTLGRKTRGGNKRSRSVLYQKPSKKRAEKNKLEITIYKRKTEIRKYQLRMFISQVIEIQLKLF